jgi:hypothetical protein
MQRLQYLFPEHAGAGAGAFFTLRANPAKLRHVSSVKTLSALVKDWATK